jgi:hypothetical protein
MIGSLVFDRVAADRGLGSCFVGDVDPDQLHPIAN